MCIVLTNSFNYFDGLDGTLIFTTTSVLAILYFLAPYENFQLFLIMILIPISIFLLFNFSFFKLPKLFLGDSGSLYLGFIISFILIYLGNKNFVHPILLAWTVSIFVYEFLSINIIRLKNRQNLFKAGKDHLHHLLFDRSKSTLFTNFFMSLLNIIFFLVGYYSFILVGSLASLILFIIFFIIYLTIRIFFEKKVSNNF